MKALNLKKFFRLYLPSLVFATEFSTYAIASNISIVSLIAGILALLLLVNLFLQNILISRVLGIIILLGSLYMVLAWLDDVVDGEATIGYIFGLLLILGSIVLSVLLIVGYKRQAEGMRNLLEMIENPQGVLSQ